MWYGVGSTWSPCEILTACNMFNNRTNMLLETRLRFLMNLEVLSMDVQFGRCPTVSWRMFEGYQKANYASGFRGVWDVWAKHHSESWERLSRLVILEVQSSEGSSKKLWLKGKQGQNIVTFYNFFVCFQEQIHPVVPILPKKAAKPKDGASSHVIHLELPGGLRAQCPSASGSASVASMADELLGEAIWSWWCNDDVKVILLLT